MQYRAVGKFRGSKVSRFVSLPLFSGIIFRGGMSCPFNCRGVVGVKFRDFNLTMKLTKFKHPRNLPTVRTIYMLYVNIALQCTLIYMCIYVCDYGNGGYTVQVHCILCVT